MRFRSAVASSRFSLRFDDATIIRPEVGGTVRGMVCELPRSGPVSAARQVSKAEVPDAAARSSMGLG